MFKILVLTLVGLVALNAANLSVVQGEVKAHTEVFGDSKIEPSTKQIKADLTMDDSIESLKGKVYFETLSLVSEIKDRDAHMYELLNESKYKTISFDISSVRKVDENYEVSGTLTLNGISKSVIAKTTINQVNKNIALSGGFSFNLTDFEIKPPKLLFLTVRNQIDISYNIAFKK